jgi:integrase
MIDKIRFMRTRNQTPTPRPRGKGRWEIGYRTAEGKQTTHTIHAKTKTDAQVIANEFIAPINQARRDRQKGADMSLGAFAEHVYIPWAMREWKDSTAKTTPDRIRLYLCRGELAAVPIAKLDRSTMQDFLDRMALKSRSTVNMVRYDLQAILRLAVADGFTPRNQAEVLKTPRTCALPNQPVMSADDVQRALAVLGLRERLFFRLAVFAGMRPGEIIALKWEDIDGSKARVWKRIYKGTTNTPKNGKFRDVALSPAVMLDLENWRRFSEGYVFPSQKKATPVSYANLWRREIQPALKTIGLEWADYHCMRRTNATLMHESKADPKVAADQRGHGVNVSMAEYTHSTVAQKAEAVGKLEGRIQ